MFDVAVIGGGASGIVCAINAKMKNPDLSVCIIERLPKIGKKILATGNGRCNITNLNTTKELYNDSEFVSFAISEYNPEKVLLFFEKIGLKCVEDTQGRVYPMSNYASNVLNVLHKKITSLDIEVISDYKVTDIKKIYDYFLINNKIKCKNVVISAGGKSSPSQGSDGSGFELLNNLGHTVTKTFPALVQLKTKEIVKALSGIRVKANLELVYNGEVIDKSNGEVLFTDYGLSGIAVMDISRKIKDKNCLCKIDVLPNMTASQIEKFISDSRDNNTEYSANDVLCGLLPDKVSQYILQGFRIKKNTKISKIDADTIKIISEKIKSMTFTVTGTNGFTNAQITVGGAKLNEFNNKTMESVKIKGLYCIGEILDIDAPCGGYNLQWAWSSGLLAGEIIAIKNGS